MLLLLLAGLLSQSVVTNPTNSQSIVQPPATFFRINRFIGTYDLEIPGGNTSPSGLCRNKQIYIQQNPGSSPLLWSCYDNTWSVQVGAPGPPGPPGPSAGLAMSLLANLPATCKPPFLWYVPDASISTGGWPIFLCDVSGEPVQLGVQADGTGYLQVNCQQGGVCLVGPNTSVIPSFTGQNIYTGLNDFSGASKTAPFRLSAGPPPTCDSISREFYFDTILSTLNVCNTKNVWTRLP